MKRGLPLIERVTVKVDLDSPHECWKWPNLNNMGYGAINIGGQKFLAHRVVYELLVGPIPEGLQLDHLCRNRPCVNPDHLEPVTNRENWLRGDAPSAQAYRTGRCKRGHSLDDAYINTGGYRRCRTCTRDAARQNYAERKRARLSNTTT